MTKEEVRNRMQPLADMLNRAGFSAEIIEHCDTLVFCLRFREETILGMPQFFEEE